MLYHIPTQDHNWKNKPWNKLTFYMVVDTFTPKQPTGDCGDGPFVPWDFLVIKFKVCAILDRHSKYVFTWRYGQVGWCLIKITTVCFPIWCLLEKREKIEVLNTYNIDTTWIAVQLVQIGPVWLFWITFIHSYQQFNIYMYLYYMFMLKCVICLYIQISNNEPFFL